jgi:arabinoxylan arabinofuranohydrolase
MNIRLLLVLLVIFFPTFIKAQNADLSAYLFVYFTGNEKAEESIHYALSNDGYNFLALNNDQPILSSAKISSTGGIRDPHILRKADGKGFYMVATDMVSAKGWDSNRAMVLLKSNDLINWSSTVVDIQKRFKGNDSLKRVWAPQTIFDKKAKKYMIYWSMKYNNGPDRIYYAYVNDSFTDLSTEPKQLFTSSDRGSAIDGDIVEFNNKFHLFYKHQDVNGAGLRIATSENLTGPFIDGNQYIQQTSSPVEGSGVFKLNDEKGYILMYDLYTKGKYQFTYSEDLKTFKGIDKQITMNFHPRHGTVMPLTKKEAVLLLEKYGNPLMATSNVNSHLIKKNNIVIDSARKKVFYPVEYAAKLKSFDPIFPKLPGMKINPEPPYDLSSGKKAVSFKIGSNLSQTWDISAGYSGNPVLNGYYADPEILYSHKNNKFYLYPTSDGFTGWSGDYFKAFSSENLRDWHDEGKILELKDVSWGTRNAWAPTIVEKNINGKFKYFYYFTAAQKIGVATSDSPAGPFKDSGKPIVGDKPKGMRGGQEIDPDVFTDPKTNRSYLYWGNGYMAVAELSSDMLSIDTATLKILKPGRDFREGTEVFYRKGKYYFLWSEDDTRSENYSVRYGFSSSPTGDIIMPANNLVLAKDPEKGIFATGHNSVIQIPGKDEWYIIYHRFTIPYGINMGEAAGYNREVCIDKLEFTDEGEIKRVIPTLEGIKPVKMLSDERK